MRDWASSRCSPADTALRCRLVADAGLNVLIRFGEQEFWTLLACCPAVREVILGDMAQRLQSHQVEALHREKLVSLGTLPPG